MASITDNSATKPYLIKIAPGVYTENNETFLKDYVDIEGSGQDVTTITCICGDSSFSYLDSVLAGVGATLHSSVRDLTVVNTGGADRSTAIATESVNATVLFDRVTAIASGGNVTNLGIMTYGSPSAPTLTDVTATATGGSLSAAGVWHETRPRR